MEMGNSSQWYSQDGAENSPVSPAAQEMRASGSAADSSPQEKAGRRAVKSDAPDLSYINSDVLGRKKSGPPPAPAQPRAPAPQQPSSAQQAQPSWADVGLD
jgi:hypothetical protein